HVTLRGRAPCVAVSALGPAGPAVAACPLSNTFKGPAPEPISPLSPTAACRTFMKNRVFLAHLGIVTCSFMGLFAWISGPSFVLQDLYGLSAFDFAVAFALGSAGYLPGTVLAAGIVTRVGLDRTIGLGGLALAVGGLAMVAAGAFCPSPPAFLVPSAAVSPTRPPVAPA